MVRRWASFFALTAAAACAPRMEPEPIPLELTPAEAWSATDNELSLDLDEAASDMWVKVFERRAARHRRRWVLEDNTPLRSYPSDKASVVGELNRGDVVHLQTIENRWAQLRSGAYILILHLTSEPPAKSAPAEAAVKLD